MTHSKQPSENAQKPRKRSNPVLKGDKDWREDAARRLNAEAELQHIRSHPKPEDEEMASLRDLTSLIPDDDSPSVVAVKRRLLNDLRDEMEKVGFNMAQRLARGVPKPILGAFDDSASDEAAESAVTELLAETGRSLAAIARHGDRIDELLEQIQGMRA
jgi:hypothetical protein